MEITFVKTLPYSHNNIPFYSTPTFRCLTYHFILPCRKKVLWSRLREADPIASNSAQQCVRAHKPFYISRLFYIQSQVLHRKTHLVI